MKFTTAFIAQAAFVAAFGGVVEVPKDGEDRWVEGPGEDTGSFRAIPNAPVEILAPVALCLDDPKWRDYQHGVPPYIGCNSMNSVTCSQDTLYAQDARFNCPESCGLCSGPPPTFQDCTFGNGFGMDIVFHNTWKTSETGKTCLCNDGVFVQCTITSNTNRCQGSTFSPTNCIDCDNLPECQWQEHKGGFCNHYLDAKFHNKPAAPCVISLPPPVVQPPLPPPVVQPDPTCFDYYGGNGNSFLGFGFGCPTGQVLRTAATCPWQGCTIDFCCEQGTAGQTGCDFYGNCGSCMNAFNCNWDPNWNVCRSNNECDFESKPQPVAVPMAAFSMEDTVEMNTVCYSRADQCWTGDESGGIDENWDGDSCTRATTCDQCVQSFNIDPLTGWSTPCVFDIPGNYCKSNTGAFGECQYDPFFARNTCAYDVQQCSPWQ